MDNQSSGFLTAVVSSIVSSFLMSTYGDDGYFTVEILEKDGLSIMIAFVSPVEDDRDDEIKLIHRVLDNLAAHVDISHVRDIFVNSVHWTNDGLSLGEVKNGHYKSRSIRG